MNSRSEKGIKGFIARILDYLRELAKHGIGLERATVNPWCARSQSGTPLRKESGISCAFSFCGCESCWDDDVDVITSVKREAGKRLSLALKKEKKGHARGERGNRFSEP